MKKHFRLPKEFAQNWLKELRSGKYKQLTSSLIYYEQEEGDLRFKYDNTQACCLGVAAVMLGIPDNALSCEMPTYIDQELLDDFKYPRELTVEDGYNLPGLLAGMNDGYAISLSNRYMNKFPGLDMKVPEGEYETIQYSFEEIADWVENNVELY